MALGDDMSNWLQGSETASMRIVTSDGFHTEYDDSDAFFSVPGAPPQMVIYGPVDGGEYPVDEPPIPDGFGEDWEDGVLCGDDLVWRSDKEGLLGTGQELCLDPRSLGIGHHVITLTAVDSDGEEAAASVQITIEPYGACLPVLYRRT